MYGTSLDVCQVASFRRVSSRHGSDAKIGPHVAGSCVPPQRASEHTKSLQMCSLPQDAARRDPMRSTVSVRQSRRSAQGNKIQVVMSRYTMLLSLLAMLLAFARCQAAVYHLVGSWLPATKNIHTEDLLAQALQKNTPALKSRLCFTEVTAIEQQIVNGIHFRYHARGCEAAAAGRCTASCPAEKNFDVELFTQPWADLIQVISTKDVQ